MAKKQLTTDGQFIVGENKGLDYVLAFLCLALFSYGLIDAIQQRFTNFSASSFVFLIAFVAAVLFFRKGNSKRIYIRINNTGIYQDEKLVTDWSNFLNAFLTQKEKKRIFEIQDNFLMVVEFRKEGTNLGIRKKIPLTNTQNKSEEEVLEAVKFFWKDYKKAMGL
ncbi:hypothetical protein CAP36_01000 [Chitinophagaceae bacterium IBVUCB2]|nr:hypothetical protein CAP36_01000 [Chitinophagaceae bacterium IBVUCB2]